MLTGDPPDDRPLYVGKAEQSLVTRDLNAEFGHCDHRNRCMAIAWFGHGDRSEATLVGPT